ncbi:uncharacterized protein F4807DRAFT_462660 [Annulohypoxylon truncatum]|uniref:uncharacterized protein n=1 Tax=Annulohypoxylon truncatum TaxID=327061 RepID=UPI0020081A8B|nr:uncharacterized protein F4807DRAFT_462660 [Annulohypoxylon truncatum]KAI1207509.1 hypothetical protein F4807DRAFT_462660 [Annulohypoxylon truncatum]
MSAQPTPIPYLLHLMLHKPPNLYAYLEETLKLKCSVHNTDDSLIPYLQPQLEVLEFKGGPISDVTLERLQYCCPELKVLLIENPHLNLCTPEGLLRYLAAATSLKRLTLRCGMESVVGDRVFITLAKASVLRSLDFRFPITTKLIEEAVAERRRFTTWNSQLFGELRELVCEADYQAITRLLPHLHKLVHLNVSVKGGTNLATRARDLFPELCRLTLQLRILIIAYLPRYPIRIDPIMMRKFVEKRCWGLEKLEVYGRAVTGKGFLEPVVDILQHSGSLKTLRLSMDCDITEVALVAAATYGGKRLHELDIGGVYNFARLESLFMAKKFQFGPQFRLLGIGKLMTPRHESLEELRRKVAEYAHFVTEFAPALEDFNILFSKKGGFGDHLEIYLKEHLEDPEYEEVSDLVGPVIKIGEKTPSL